MDVCFQLEVLRTRRLETHVARRDRRGAGSERVRVLLNRTSDQLLIAPKQIETALGYSIHHSFGSDYRTVSTALNSGVPLTMTNHSEISSQFGSFTKQLLGLEGAAAAAAPDKRRPFLGIL